MSRSNSDDYWREQADKVKTTGATQPLKIPDCQICKNEGALPIVHYIPGFREVVDESCAKVKINGVSRVVCSPKLAYYISASRLYVSYLPCVCQRGRLYLAETSENVSRKMLEYTFKCELDARDYIQECGRLFDGLKTQTTESVPS